MKFKDMTNFLTFCLLTVEIAIFSIIICPLIQGIMPSLMWFLWVLATGGLCICCWAIGYMMRRDRHERDN